MASEYIECESLLVCFPYRYRWRTRLSSILDACRHVRLKARWHAWPSAAQGSEKICRKARPFKGICNERICSVVRLSWIDQHINPPALRVHSLRDSGKHRQKSDVRREVRSKAECLWVCEAETLYLRRFTRIVGVLFLACEAKGLLVCVVECR